jgi:hypothetical protein
LPHRTFDLEHASQLCLILSGLKRSFALRGQFGPPLTAKIPHISLADSSTADAIVNCCCVTNDRCFFAKMVLLVLPESLTPRFQEVYRLEICTLDTNIFIYDLACINMAQLLPPPQSLPVSVLLSLSHYFHSCLIYASSSSF